MTLTDANDRIATTSAPISEVIAARWSPRSFDTTIDIDEQQLISVLEAARWAPSASNTQPWRFIVARRGSAAHTTIVENLIGFNQAWAGSAAALIVNLTELETAEGKKHRWAEYDLGQAAVSLALQAHKDGLHAHQMGGIEVDGLREAFSIDPRYEIVSVTALGVMASPDALPNETLREREIAPRSRKPLSELVLVSE